MGQILDCFGKGTEFTQSHRLEEAIPDSYDKCEPGFRFTTTTPWLLSPCFVDQVHSISIRVISGNLKVVDRMYKLNNINM